jgi:uncharacterized protein (TIGR03067 family)
MTFAAGLLVAAARGEDADKPEAKKLLGTWVVVTCEKDGEKVPEKVLQGEVVRFIIRADSITIKVEDEIKSEERYTLDPRAKPQAIDLTDKEGRIARGIYALDGEKLQICWTERGKTRPTEFASKPGSGFDLFVLKREKD